MSAVAGGAVVATGVALALETINKILQIAILRPDLLDKLLGPQQAVLDAYVAGLKEAPPPKTQ